MVNRLLNTFCTHSITLVATAALNPILGFGHIPLEPQKSPTTRDRDHPPTTLKRGDWAARHLLYPVSCVIVFSYSSNMLYSVSHKLLPAVWLLECGPKTTPSPPTGRALGLANGSQKSHKRVFLSPGQQQSQRVPPRPTKMRKLEQ